MTDRKLNVQHIQRHDISSRWSSVNPILKQGMIGVEDDTNRFKVGDGVTPWNELSYSGGNATNIVDKNSGMAYTVWIGTQDEYTGLQNKDDYTIYIIK